MIRSDQKVKGNARIQKKGFDYPAGEKAIPIFPGYSRKQNRPTLRLYRGRAFQRQELSDGDDESSGNL